MDELSIFCQTARERSRRPERKDEQIIVIENPDKEYFGNTYAITTEEDLDSFYYEDKPKILAVFVNGEREY